MFKGMRQFCAGATLAVCASMSITSAAIAAEAPHVNLAVGGQVGLFYLPVTVAARLGYFKDAGLDVELIDLGSGGKALEALVGGSADVTAGAYEHTVQMQPKDISLTAFVLMGRLIDYSLGVSKAKISGYHGPADLKGMRIGVSSPGSGTNIFLNLILAKAGLKPSDVSIIGIGQTAGAVAAVRHGQVDAVANTDPVMTTLEESSDIKIVADARTEKGSELVYGGPYPAASLYASAGYVKKHPKVIQALTTAMVRTLKWMSHATPDQIIKILPASFTAGDPVTFRKALVKLLPTYSHSGLFPSEGPETVRRALASFDAQVRDSKIVLKDTYTNAFVKNVLAKLSD